MGMGGEELVRKDLQVWMTAEGEAKQKIRGSGTNQQSGSNINNIRWNQMKAGRMKQQWCSASQTEDQKNPKWRQEKLWQ